MKADFIVKSNAVFFGTEEKLFEGGVAVKDNRILAVGGNSVLKHCMGDSTIVKEYGDRLIMPGFVDAHSHIFDGSVMDSGAVCPLWESVSEWDAVNRLKRYAAEHEENIRIRGFGWLPTRWNDSAMPTKESLDRAFPDIPVCCISADFQTGWLNTAALEEAGYMETCESRVSEALGKEGNGKPSGIVNGAYALRPALERYLDFDKASIRKQLSAVLKKMRETGITAVGDMSVCSYSNSMRRRFAVMKELSQKDQLTARVYAYADLFDPDDSGKALQYKKLYEDVFFSIPGVKGFCDGSFPTYTAWTLGPYADWPERKIHMRPEQREQLKRSISAANAEGLSVRLHCCGEGAVRAALDIYEAAGRSKTVCNTIEHAQMIAPEDFQRFGALGVIPSVMPYHLILDVDEMILREGSRWSKWEWPLNSLLESGAEAAFGTGFPTGSQEPMKGIYAAVFRRDEKGRAAGCNPQEAITLKQALRAHTAGAAAALGCADLFGTLEIGKYADIVALNTIPLNTAGKDLYSIKSVLTMMNGKIVFEEGSCSPFPR